MMMVVGEGRDDAGAEPMGLAVGQFERRDLLQVIVQEPGMVNQALQDQRLPAGERRALAAHDRAIGKLGACGLVRPAAEGLGGRGTLPAPCGKPPAGRGDTLWKTT